MRIVYVVTRADAVGGASIHVRDLARAMIGRGHDVTVVVGGSGPVTDLLEAVGVPFLSAPSLRRAVHPWRDLMAVSEMASILRDLRPELVSTHTAKAGWIGRAACARLGIPAIYTPHGLAVGSRLSPVSGAVFALAERAASRWCKAIICVSEAERRLALEKRIAPASALKVVYNGVHDVPPELRADPGRESFRICAVARMEEPKDHATLLRALARLASLPWELELVGDGPLEPSIRALAESLGVARRVRFAGYKPDAAPSLAAAQVFALSSRSEAFPRCVLEAMRAGLPVVASDVGGVREAVIHGETGLLVPSGRPDALASALASFADPKRRVETGASARASYIARFRAERMVENTSAIYATVLDRAAI